MCVEQSDFAFKQCLVTWIFCPSPSTVFLLLIREENMKKILLLNDISNESKYKIVYILRSSGINCSFKITGYVESCFTLFVCTRTVNQPEM